MLEQNNLQRAQPPSREEMQALNDLLSALLRVKSLGTIKIVKWPSQGIRVSLRDI